MAKCNLDKVNLELMQPAVSPSLHMIRGGAPLEFAGGKLRTALLASDHCDHCFCFAFIMKNVPNGINKASLPPNLYRLHDIFKSDGWSHTVLGF